MAARTYITLRHRIRGKKSVYRYLSGCAGANRFMWNQALAHIEREQEEAEDGKADFSAFTLNGLIPKLRNSAEYPWMKLYPAADYRGATKRLSDAKRAFVQGKRKPPRFKKRGKCRKSFDLLDRMRRLKPDGTLHFKRGMKVRLMDFDRLQRYRHPIARKITVFEDRGRWYAAVTYKVDAVQRPARGAGIGIDRNAGQLYDSTGVQHTQPDHTDLDRRIDFLKRRAARQNRGSGRWHDTQRTIARLLRQRRDINRNHARHVAKRITQVSELVFLEDLNVKGMTRSAKGTVENPGTNVKQKSGLNRAIQDTTWSVHEQYLAERGCVVKVPAAYTSQRCGGCGHTESGNRRERQFKCKSCGLKMHADHNAALNIMASGRASVKARRGLAVTRPMKREYIGVGG